MSKLIKLAFKAQYFATRVQSVNSKAKAFTAIDFYNNLLLNTPTNKNGRYKFQTNDVGHFVNMVEKDNIKEAIEGFNNILGHNNQVHCGIKDKFMLKCIEFDQTKYVLDALKFHSAIRYFPHPSVIMTLAKKLDDEGLIELFKILKTCPFLKIDSANLSSLIKDDPKISYEVYRVALQKKIKLQPKDLYRIARQFLSGNKVRKVGFMTQFAQENGNENDIYSSLSVLFTHVYLTNKQQAIVELAKVIEHKDGLTILKEEEQYIKPLLEILQKQVDNDEKWKPRLDELISKLS
ncbi:unnamed protein product [Paramecium octaurelia]|uniref:Uncharacterized protein n=1 Tax=Paramecium octaurelia TaxID=43137 RepID=A0A8S1SYB0_PAROT|nr:unnamed protein product [Paramecium octaurelia]